MTRTEIERNTQALAGRRIAQVHYLEVDYWAMPSEPMWNRDERFDSLSLGLELVLDNDAVFFITWDADFDQTGLFIIPNSAQHFAHPRRWDVTSSSRWKHLVGQRIEHTRVFWSWQIITAQGQTELRDFPIDLELTFESKQRV